MARHSRSEIHPAYLIIVAILCVSSLVSCLWFFIEKTKIYQEFTQKINWLDQENSALSSKIEKADNEKLNLAIQVKQLEDKLKEFTAEKNNFSKKLDSLVKENQTLSSEVQGLNKEKLVLEDKIKELQSDTFLADLIKQKTTLELQLSQLKNNLQNTQPVLQDASSSQVAMDSKLDEIVQAKVKMEEALKSERQLTENLSNQILQERKERMLAKIEKEELEKKLTQTRGLQESLQIQFSRLASDLEIAKKEKDFLNNQLSLLSQNITTKSKELEAMNSALNEIPVSSGNPSVVQLPPVIVRADQKIEWLPRKGQGEVISIDKEHNFVIINLGEIDDINPGQVFKVVRQDQDKDIARVEVIQTRKTISACDIKEIKPGFTIEKDDRAVLIP